MGLLQEMASHNYTGKDLPLPYPPPTYSANPVGYGGWVPPTRVFPEQSRANTVNMTNAPAPYPAPVPASPAPFPAPVAPYPSLNVNNGHSSGGGWTKPAQAHVPPPSGFSRR